MDEEIQELADKEGVPAASISIDRRVQPVVNSSGDGFICPFLGSADNQCRIYNLRPFECQLYPFLINLRSTRPYRIGRYALLRREKVLLTVDLNCPYVYEKIDTPLAKEYIIYLTAYLNSPKMLKVLKDNPQIIQAYEEVREIAELGLPHETK